MPAKSHLVCLSSINLRNRDTMTMEVVKLSNNAEKKNVKTPSYQTVMMMTQAITLTTKILILRMILHEDVM